MSLLDNTVSSLLLSGNDCTVLTQHTEKLSLNVLARMLDTHDILMLLCPLIESPPWTWRHRETAQWLKYEHQNWKVVKPINLLKLTKLEGQIWLSLYNILTDKTCGERYYFSSQRKDNLLRARKYLNDVLLDQLPMLADIQRFMDEITIMKPPEASAKNMYVISYSFVLSQTSSLCLN